jgi:hypothetical protein
MLIRLGPADAVPAGQRMVRVERRDRALVLPRSAGHETCGQGHERAWLAAQRGFAAEPGSAARQGGQGSKRSKRSHSSEFDCCDATWSVASDPAPSHAQPLFPFRTQHISEAYRATDPVQPRPGLYLHVRA